VADPKELQRELQILESDLRKLEGEYNMYFSGRLPRPPWETRHRVEGTIKRLDRGVMAEPKKARPRPKTKCFLPRRSRIRSRKWTSSSSCTTQCATRGSSGQNIPFNKFTGLVKAQVSKLKKDGAPEVAFRVSLKDGKLNFTARGLKGEK
jgi:hypothetical protein